MRTISSVAAISKFSRVCSSVARRADVAILDVPAILAQMHRDVVGARLLGDQRGEHRVRIARAPRLAQRGDVVDVDSEMQHGRDATRISPPEREHDLPRAQLLAFQAAIERGTQQRARLGADAPGR